MAWFRRYRILSLAAALTALLLGVPGAAQEAAPGLYDRPVLVLDPGMHTASLRRMDVDAAGTLAVTGSHDGTVRLWSVADGRLLRTIRVPQGPGNVGKIYAVAISPDGAVIAAGGWTRWTPQDPQQQIYLFDARTGAMTGRIAGLPNVVNHLAFSPDGRRLAASLGAGGLRIYDREQGWKEIARDTDYAGLSLGAAFALDGRLATTSYDGKLRLYGADGSKVAERETGFERPLGLSFSPDRRRLAVGFIDSTAVHLYDGATLEPLPPPDTSGINNGNLASVAWSADGSTLYAGGRYQEGGIALAMAWGDGGAGARRSLPAGLDTLISLRGLPGGDLLAAATDPWLGRLAPDGTPRWTRAPVQMDARDQDDTLSVSQNGMVVDFGYRVWGADPARVDLSTLALSAEPPEDDRTALPLHDGLAITGWKNTTRPALDGTPLPLKRYEFSRSLAIHPDGDRFVLGTEWSLRAFDAEGTQLWRRAVPGVVWAVNISGDGRLAVAAYGDGTIRWHRMEDGA
ncbi:MAG: WD40 repeat domain-containing protein, partial [Pseudomonadota bacterium]